jgi:DNA-binding MarR family transcriptional regulator
MARTSRRRDGSDAARPSGAPSADAPTRDLPSGDAPTADVVRLEGALTEVIRLARDPRLTERMSAGIDAGVDRRLFLLLNLIADRGPMRASDLIDVMAVDQSTVSRQLTALVGHGLVERSVDPRDARAALVCTTEAGMEAIGIARQAWRHTLAELTAEWSPTRRAALSRSLTELAAGLDRIVQEPLAAPA